MTLFSRADPRAISRWFWTIDRVLLGMLILLLCLGVVLSLSASEAETFRINRAKITALPPLYFFYKQLVFSIAAAVLMLGTSLLTPTTLRRLCAIAFPILFACLLLTFAFPAIKGAHRWVNLPLMSFQPSEFMKPVLIVVSAWILSAKYDDPNAPAIEVSFAVMLGVVATLILQPDFGQSGLIIITWLAQAALAGLSFYWLAGGFAALIGGIGIAAMFRPHVAQRLETFFNPTTENAYQSTQALDAFRSGGIFGVGPAEGTVKMRIPDAHTDYIFAMAGEELGLLACCAIVLLYLAILHRTSKQLLDGDKPFVFLAGAGLAVQFTTQAFINLGVNVNILPSKGMTLPFLSYGGSSVLALGFGMGMVLAFTRQNRSMIGFGRPARSR
jgi:cell division protein FtsW